MKILQITPFYMPATEFGGPVFAVDALTRELKKRGHEVDVCSLDMHENGQRIPAHLHRAGVMYLPSWLPRVFAPKHFFWSWSWPKVLWRYRSVDVVHFHDFYIFYYAFLAVGFRIMGKTIFVTPHGSLQQNKSRGKAGPKQFYLSTLGTLFLLFVNAVIVNSEHEKAFVQAVLPVDKKVNFIPNIITPIQPVNRTQFSWRKYLHISEQSKLFLYVGRIYALKGIFELVTSFHAFLNKLPIDSRHDVALAIAGGDAGDADKLAHHIATLQLEDRVYLLGNVSGKRKQALYTQSDALFHLSYSEGLPTVLIEAASIGLPSFYTEECNLPGLAEAGGGQHINRDPSIVAQAMYSIYSASRAVKKQYSTNAKHWYTSNFKNETIVRQYEAVYNQLG